MYKIMFYDGFFASTYYTVEGAHPKSLDEAIESAEEEYEGEAFELWGSDGEYQSEAFSQEMNS